jgi:hypothetical protein
MKSVYLESVGIAAPGLANWPECSDVLRGKSGYHAQPIPRFVPDSLPVNERRRISPTIRLALQAATESIHHSTLDPENVATVFATSNGDLEICDRICTALTLPDRPVSPTDFHNSIHNAPAGYWSIGSHCRMPSTSISAGNESFSAALLESVTQVLSENLPVMLVAYDQPPPDIFSTEHTATIPFSTALVFTHQRTDHSKAELTVVPVEKISPQALQTVALEDLRSGNSVAQSLLLLEMVARNSSSECILPYHDSGGLQVNYLPC